MTSTLALRASFVPSVSAGETSLTSTDSSTCTGLVSATALNETLRCEPAGTVTDVVPRTDGPQSRVTVAVPPVSPFSSAISACTSIGLVVSVCNGA